MTSIEHRIISVEQLEELASRPEDHYFDRKSKNIRVAKLTKTISGLANADGGEIILGLEDTGSVNAFSDFEAMNGMIQGLDQVYPMSLDYMAEGLEISDGRGFLLLLTVQKSASIIVAQDKIVYVRRGAQSLPYTDEKQLETLRRAKGLTSFETETLPCPIDEVANSLVINEFLLEQIPTAEPEAWLRKQKLIVGDRPTVACVLLFHDEPQVYLPKAAVKLYRYTTADSVGTREHLAFQPLTIEGDIYTLIHDTVARTVAEVEKIEVASAEGISNVVYPSEAIHEIVTNAVLHREYGLTDDVHVRIYDNRIEVESPGRLPAHITPRNILNERFARNGAIVRLINKFPDAPNKDVGEGLNTAFEAMKSVDLRDPEILEKDNSVLVVVRHERLASPEAQIISYLQEEEKARVARGESGAATVNNSKAREVTGIHSDREVLRVFQRLEEMGQLERVPGTIKGGSKYRLVNREEFSE